MSLKRGKIRPCLLLMNNRKSHTRFRLQVPKSTTLDDLERLLRTLYQNICVFGAHHENLNKDRLILYQKRRCSSIRGGSLESSVKRQWGNRKRRFSVLSDATYSEPYYIALFSPYLDPLPLLIATYVTLNNLEWPFYVKFCLCAGKSGIFWEI